MCGIVGYVGNDDAYEPVLNGLKALEYRGYDSAGIVALNSNQAVCVKQIGAVENLEKKLNTTSKPANTAIGHTRWATHGVPSITNAHPHTNAQKTIFVVHNGIIENYQVLQAELQKHGYQFVSDTDTEVIPHLIDWHLKKTKKFHTAFERAIKELRGAFAIAAVHTAEPDTLYVARLSSPLVVGVGKSEYFIASDAAAILEQTKRVIYLDDYDIARITANSIDVTNLRASKPVKRSSQLLDYSAEQAKLGNFSHFMLKEIYDAPQTVLAATRGRVKPKIHKIVLGGLASVEEQLRFIDRIVIVACGTSYYAGMVGEYLIEELAGIPVEVQLASEFKYRREPFSRSTAVLAISQSGETADTIAALKKVEQYGVLKLGIVNVVGSTIARMTDAGVYCHAGPEQSVASTKAFIAQVTILIEMALYLGKVRSKHFKTLLDALAHAPSIIENILADTTPIKKIAKRYAKSKNFLYIGRGYAYPCALEGALKLKEVSYIHAEGYSAGEMKHGPLAMIDQSFPTLAIILNGEVHQKTLANIEEIRTRNGPVIVIAPHGDKTAQSLSDDVLYIPNGPEQIQTLYVAVVLQLFAYYVAIARGKNVDRPRNLAKSVTVE